MKSEVAFWKGPGDCRSATQVEWCPFLPCDLIQREMVSMFFFFSPAAFSLEMRTVDISQAASPGEDNRGGEGAGRF